MARFSSNLHSRYFFLSQYNGPVTGINVETRSATVSRHLKGKENNQIYAHMCVLGSQILRNLKNNMHNHLSDMQFECKKKKKKKKRRIHSKHERVHDLLLFVYLFIFNYLIYVQGVHSERRFLLTHSYFNNIHT